MNLGDMVQVVEERLEEELGSPVRYLESEILDAINDGIEELSDSTEFYERSTVIHLRPLATYYDLRSAASTQILRITSIWSDTRNTWLIPSDVRQLDQESTRQWERATGDSQRWFVRGGWWLGLFPKTNSLDRIIRINAKCLHPRMALRTERPQQLPEEYHPALISYALGDLLSKDGETTKAIQHWTEYGEHEKALALRLRGRVSRDRVGRMGAAR
jgi:hypothetical protein